MIFNSLQFVFFFVIVTTLYFLLPHKFRWFLLLVASCYFYMAFVPIYIVILGGTIVVDYFAGIFIERSEGKKRKLFLVCSLIANIGVLAVFKYYNFLNENLSHIFSFFGKPNPIPFLTILLPIGLSFHTFQAMSYTIEVYRGKQKAERNFGIYALYVMFYPQLVAGPIERPQNVLHQFYEKHSFDIKRIVDGLTIMLLGFFKKLVVADRLSIFVDSVYNNDPSANTGIGVIIATVFFAIQIYCDFSGYSDIAIGCAKVLGIDLMQNFRQPYFSKSISEFWSRWHISLTTWFKDYLYIPLGGSRVKKSRWYFNLFIVFLVSGLWHGANWTYIIWGALNGFYLVFAIVSQKYRDKIGQLIGLNRVPAINAFIQMVITFGLICFAWIFFRASSVEKAFGLIKRIPDLRFRINDKVQFLYCLFAILLLMIIEIKQVYFKDKFVFFYNKNLVLRNLSYACLILIIILLGVFNGGQFIYFQF